MNQSLLDSGMSSKWDHAEKVGSASHEFKVGSCCVLHMSSKWDHGSVTLQFPQMSTALDRAVLTALEIEE